jgi:hypothetical protein
MYLRITVAPIPALTHFPLTCELVKSYRSNLGVILRVVVLCQSPQLDFQLLTV